MTIHLGRTSPCASSCDPELGGQGDISGPTEGQVFVLNFWASWCLECHEEHDALVAAWERYRERGVVFVDRGPVQPSEKGALTQVYLGGVTFELVVSHR